MKIWAKYGNGDGEWKKKLGCSFPICEFLNENFNFFRFVFSNHFFSLEARDKNQ